VRPGENSQPHAAPLRLPAEVLRDFVHEPRQILVLLPPRDRAGLFQRNWLADHFNLVFVKLQDDTPVFFGIPLDIGIVRVFSWWQPGRDISHLAVLTCGESFHVGRVVIAVRSSFTPEANLRTLDVAVEIASQFQNDRLCDPSKPYPSRDLAGMRIVELALDQVVCRSKRHHLFTSFWLLRGCSPQDWNKPVE